MLRNLLCTVLKIAEVDGEVFWHEEFGYCESWGPCFLFICQIVLGVCSCIWFCC